jgi:hypothetical protein
MHNDKFLSLYLFLYGKLSFCLSTDMWPMKYTISRCVRLRNLVEVYRRFGETYCRHLQDGRASHVSCNQRSHAIRQYSSHPSQSKPQVPQFVNYVRHLLDTIRLHHLHNGHTLHLCSGGDRFEPQPGHRLSWVLNPSRQKPGQYFD